MEKYYDNIHASRNYQLTRYHQQPEKAQQYYKTNKEELTRKRKLFRESLEYRAYSIWNSARNRAKNNDLAFDITREFVEEKLKLGVCDRSGIPFDFAPATNGEQRNRFSPSIDKIDRTKGYVQSNVQIVLWCYNTGRGEMSDEQFIEFCKAVAEFNR